VTGFAFDHLFDDLVGIREMVSRLTFVPQTS
jgi:hypothetical protein